MADAEATRVDTVDPTAVRRARTWKIVSTVVILASMLAGGLILKWTREFWNNSDAALVVDPQYLDFGDVWAQPDFEWKIQIRNTIGRDIRISEFRLSCNCTSIEPKSLTIPAGQTRDVKLRIDLMPPKSSQTGEELREFEAGVAAITDSRYVADYTWAIHGRMRTIFTNLPAEIDFGQTCIAGEVYPEKRISLEARIVLESLEATVDSAHALVTMEQVDTEGKEFTISIIPSESLPPGPFAFPIRLHAQSAAVGALPRNRFMVLGEIIGPVFAVPSAVEFGIVREGETAEQNVVLQSPLGKPIEVSEARVDDGVGQVRDGHDHVAANRLECVLQNQNESSALSCLVRFKAATPGDWSRNVMFRTRLEDGRVVDVVVPVRAIVIRRSG